MKLEVGNWQLTIPGLERKNPETARAAEFTWADVLKEAALNADGLSQAVQISWADAHSGEDWAEIDNARADVDDGAIVESIGFVLEVGEKYVLLASSIHWPHCFGRLHIPLGWIEHVTPLAIALQLPTTEEE